MPDEIVSNTSPLLNLALIERLDLVKNQFEGIKVPEQVWKELGSGEGFEAIQELDSEGFIEIKEVEEDELFKEILEDIDRGEAAALRLSLQENTELVLLDEKEGRKVARRHEIKVTGVIGVLLQASRNENADLEKEIEKLRSEGFWLSDQLVKEIINEEISKNGGETER